MTTTFKKSAVGITLAAIAMFGIAGSVSAQTPSLESLLQQIAALTAQLNALQGGSTGSTTCGATTYGYTATSTLRPGMSGASVKALQTALNMYAGASLSTDGAYGPATSAAVKAFQTSKGLSADGIAGPVTQGALQTASMMAGSNCGTDNNGSTGTLNGTVGSLKTVTPTVLTQYNNEDVGEGQNDVVVAGWEFEADNGSDLQLSSARLKFNNSANTGGSTILKKYVDSVTVLLNGEEVGSANAEDFNKDSSGIYSLNVSLDNSAIIKAGKKAKLTIAVSAQDTIDSTDLTGEAWTIDVETLRYVDGSGAIMTDTLTITAVSMDFVDFSSAADTEFKISKDSDSPEAGVIIVDDEDGEDDVVLLSGRFRLEGDSDVNLEELPVTFTVGGGYLLSDMAGSLKLRIDGEEYSPSSSATTSGATSTIVFDNLDFDISAGDTVDYEIVADINGTTEFGEGGTLLASITSDNRSAIDMTNDEGDQVADSDKTGTAVGEAQEFRSEGVKVTLVGTPTAIATGDTTVIGTYTIKFKVEAVGDDVYVGTVAHSSKYTFALQNGSQGTTDAGLGKAITNQGGNGNSTSTTSGGNWKINEGTSASFTLTLSASSASVAGDMYRAVMTGLYWSTSDADAITTTDNNYTSNMEDFVTDFLTLS